MEFLVAEHASITGLICILTTHVTLSADPNRGGLSYRLVGYLRSCGARRLLYVSCNVSTQARDMQLLCAAVPRGPMEDDVSDRCELCLSSANR